MRKRYPHGTYRPAGLESQPSDSRTILVSTSLLEKLLRPSSLVHTQLMITRDSSHFLRRFFCFLYCIVEVGRSSNRSSFVCDALDQGKCTMIPRTHQCRFIETKSEYVSENTVIEAKSTESATRKHPNLSEKHSNAGLR